MPSSHAVHTLHAMRCSTPDWKTLRKIWLGGIASDWKRVDLWLHTALDEYLGLVTDFWVSGRLEELKLKLLLKVATAADLAAKNLRTARSDSIVEDLGRWGAHLLCERTLYFLNANFILRTYCCSTATHMIHQATIFCIYFLCFQWEKHQVTGCPPKETTQFGLV